MVHTRQYQWPTSYDAWCQWRIGWQSHFDIRACQLAAISCYQYRMWCFSVHEHAAPWGNHVFNVVTVRAKFDLATASKYNTTRHCMQEYKMTSGVVKTVQAKSHRAASNKTQHAWLDWHHTLPYHSLVSAYALQCNCWWLLPKGTQQCSVQLESAKERLAVGVTGCKHAITTQQSLSSL